MSNDRPSETAATTGPDAQGFVYDSAGNVDGRRHPDFALLPCPACGAMSDDRSERIPAHRRERAAIALWHRFGSPHQIDWNDEPHKAEFRAAVDALVEAINGR